MAQLVSEFPRNQALAMIDWLERTYAWECVARVVVELALVLSFLGESYLNSIYSFGVWLSLVERLVRDQEVGRSNRLTPTIKTVYPFGYAVFIFVGE